MLRSSHSACKINQNLNDESYISCYLFSLLTSQVIGIQWLVSNPADLVMTSISRVFSEATQASKAVQNFTEEPEEIIITR